MRRYSTFSRSRKPQRYLSILGFIIFLFILGIALYTLLDNSRIVIRTQRISIARLPTALEGFTILHISDLSGKEFGAHQNSLQKRIQNTRYHAVCITGDMVGKNGNAYPFWDLISALDPTKPIFFIPGDADPPPNPDDPTNYVSEAQIRGAHYLGATQSIIYRGETVWFTPESMLMIHDPADIRSQYIQEIARLNDDLSHTAQRLQRQVEALTQEESARAAIQPNDLHIILAHRPFDQAALPFLQEITSSGDPFYRSIYLFLAGHLAGGQWRLPSFGPIFIPGYGFFPSDIDTINLGSFTQSISRGLGNGSETGFLPIRLFNPPEITLITFTSDWIID